MNTETRKLEISELEVVSGGNALISAIIRAYAVARSIEKTLAEADEPASYVPMQL